MIRKPAVRRVKLEVGATPDDGFFEKRRFQRAVHPSATTPMRRSRIPIRMVIKGYQNEWCGDLAQPNRGQMMEIARAEQRKRRQFSCHFFIEGFNNSPGCAVAESRAPSAAIQTATEVQSVYGPSRVEVDELDIGVHYG